MGMRPVCGRVCVKMNQNRSWKMQSEKGYKAAGLAKRWGFIMRSLGLQYSPYH